MSTTTIAPCQQRQQRQQRLRTLLRTCPADVEQRFAHLLGPASTRTQGCPPLAALIERDGRPDLILGEDEWEIAEEIEQALSTSNSIALRPRELVNLQTGERRAARVCVFFAPNQMHMPPLVAAIVELALGARRRTGTGDAETEAQLEQAAALIRDREPVPASAFAAISEVIAYELEDRCEDADRDPDTERLLASIHRQLLGREPTRL